MSTVEHATAPSWPADEPLWLADVAESRVIRGKVSWRWAELLRKFERGHSLTLRGVTMDDIIALRSAVTSHQERHKQVFRTKCPSVSRGVDPSYITITRVA